jgi:ATP-dependent Clp protease ATP-binding subunit ClpC
MFERFTDRAREVVVLAQDEARALRHNYIGTEHILLGLLREQAGLAARVLASLGVTLAEARARVEPMVAPSDEVTSGQIPFTPRAKKVLELALREALALGHDYIGTEHILLGLVRENEGVASRVLLSFDADSEKIRIAVIRFLPQSEGHGRSGASSTGAVRGGQFRFTVGPDPDLRRLLMAAGGRALSEERDEFGLADLLAVAKDLDDASDEDSPGAGS